MFAGRFTTAIAILALTFIAAHVHGAIITWEFAGEVTVVDDPQGTLGGRVQVGDPLAGTYTFDSTMPDAWPYEDPTYARYYSGASGIAVSIGNLMVNGPAPNCFMTVVNRDDEDRLTVFGGGFESNEIRIAEFAIGFRDLTASVFSSEALPLVPPDLNDFSIHAFSLQGSAPDSSCTVQFQFGGTISSFTPEPLSAAGWIILFAYFIKRQRLVTARRTRLP